MRKTLAAFATLTLLVGACGNDRNDDPADAGTNPDAAVAGDCIDPPVYAEEVSSCQPLSTDYQPRVNGSADDSWPACISDDGQYHRLQESVSTIARVEAFDQIADLLWRDGKVPSAQDFVDARVLYAQDQGLDSRVQRREDVHFPADAQGRKCSDEGVPEAIPDRCVGPAKLLPVLNDAFARGAQGESPRVQAARIEAALLWFLYVSPLSEATSCAAKPADCDSAWAYYTGGTPRESPAGLAAYVDALGPETHDRAYDGALAVRCWRNLDNETGEAANLALRDQARAQYDRALLRGVALIARQRFTELDCADEAGTEARLAFLRTLVPFLDRAATEIDATAAAALQAEAAAAEPDVAKATAAIDALFACP
mgnify:CR=1 FL=1